MATTKDYFILCTLDEDDESMNNQEVRDRLLNEYGNLVMPVWGTSKSKIDAINRDIEFLEGADIVILMSDDMKFIAKGFDQTIIDDFTRLRPDLDAIFHYPDGHVNERLLTMPIMGMPYLKRTGTIYESSYFSLWADNEQQIVGQMLGRYYYIPTRLFDHEHFIWGYGEKDDLLSHTESFYNIDYQNFLNRKEINFGLPQTT